MCDLGIIIVSWNVSALLERCLNSIFASEGAFQYRVVVVDNASSDDSVEMINSRYQQAELLTNETNVGYSAANNMGLRALGFTGSEWPRPRYVLLLNPDTELPPNAIFDMLRYLGGAAVDRRSGTSTNFAGWQPRPRLSPQLPIAKRFLLAFYRLSTMFPA